ncbi:MAG: FtsX-like permease family protein, partial [Bryobacteraceae bacterium]
QNPLVAIVDQSLAKRYWPNESAIGKRIRFGPPEDNEPWQTIVGVAGNVFSQSLTKFMHMDAYIPLNLRYGPGFSMIVRTQRDPTLEIPAVNQRIRAMDRDIAIGRMQTFEQILDFTSWQERFFALLFSVFAALSLLLAAAGLYGVLAYTISLRTHEIGIRMALGATPGQVRNLMVGKGLVLACLGVALGTIAALGLTRVLRSQLYNVSATDPVTFAGVALLLGSVALVACWLPSRRAVRVDPVIALREE